MNVVYRDILSELHAAIEKAMIHNRFIEYIELERHEWNEFRKAMLRLDHNLQITGATDWKYEGIDIRSKEDIGGTYF